MHRRRSRMPTYGSSPLPATSAGDSAPHADVVVFSAPAGHAGATIGAPDLRSSHAHAFPGRPGCDDIRIEGIGPRARASPSPPAHHASPGVIRSAAPIVPPASARAPVVPRCRVYTHTRPIGDARTRSPFFCCHLYHHLDLEVSLGQQLFELRVLGFNLPETLYIVACSSSKRLRHR